METRDMPPLRRAQWKKKFFPYLLMSPTLLLVLIFLIIPLALRFTAVYTDAIICNSPNSWGCKTMPTS